MVSEKSSIYTRIIFRATQLKIDIPRSYAPCKNLNVFAHRALIDSTKSKSQAFTNGTESRFNPDHRNRIHVLFEGDDAPKLGLRLLQMFEAQISLCQFTGGEKQIAESNTSREEEVTRLLMTPGILCLIQRRC